MNFAFIIVMAFVLLIPYSAFGEIVISSDGGECSEIGTWDDNSKTCTLNKDLNQTIVFTGNKITLDGNGFTIDGNDGNTGEVNITTDSCIYAEAKLGIVITDFDIKNCGFGIYFDNVLDSTIENNVISKNYAAGIAMRLSDNNLIKNNLIQNNPNGGISFNGKGNLIDDNQIIENSEPYKNNISELRGTGIHLSGEDSSNIFKNNLIKTHQRGINFDGVHVKNEILQNEILQNEWGINLGTSEKSFITGNIIKDSEIGIQSGMYYDKGGKNTIQRNQITKNAEGMRLDSISNIIMENDISYNSKYGLNLVGDRSDGNNKISKNNFIDNFVQATNGYKNFFTVDGAGNYWSEYSLDCIDSNSDKICDEPYPFSSGTIGVVDTAVWKEKDGWKNVDLKTTISEPEEPPRDAKIEGFTPPPENQKELGIASFVDKSKDPQYYVDRYNNEPDYKDWFDHNYPQYDSIEQAVGLELTEKIPDWVKNIFGWYANDQVSEDELLNAIKYLINEGILIVE